VLLMNNNDEKHEKARKDDAFAFAIDTHVIDCHTAQSCHTGSDMLYSTSAPEADTTPC
jgi:hypothetical protein